MQLSGLETTSVTSTTDSNASSTETSDAAILESSSEATTPGIKCA